MSSAQSFGSRFPVTTSALAANIVIYLAMAYSFGTMEFTGRQLGTTGAAFPPAIWAGEYWRLLTAGFLHAGLLHIAFNMFFLFRLGPVMEEVYGWKRFGIIYVFSLITASSLSMWPLPVILDQYYPLSVGASGALLGIVGAAIGFGWVRHNSLKFFLKHTPEGRWAVSTLIIIGVLGLLIPNIDNMGHLGGLLGGIGAGYVLSKNMMRRWEEPWHQYVAIAALLLAATLMAVAAALPLG